jgi:hypothetical protein
MISSHRNRAGAGGGGGGGGRSGVDDGSSFGFKFILDQQPPSYPFSGIPFDIKVSLRDNSGIIKAVNSILPLSLSLVYDSADLSDENELVEVSSLILSTTSESPPVLGSKGQSTINIMIQEAQKIRENRKVRIRISYSGITSALSHPIQLVYVNMYVMLSVI